MASEWIAVAGNVLLFCLVFCMSATVDINCMKVQLNNYPALLTGLFCQFVMLPFLGFLVVKTMNLDLAVEITLLVVTSSPGGSYSNWWCSLFNADLALSVSMTAVSTILSVVTLPLNLLLYTHFSYSSNVVKNLDWNALFMSLLLVILAITLGIFCSAKIHSRQFNKVANLIGNMAGLMLIIFSATMTNTGSAESKIWSRHWTFYVAVALPCVGGIILSNAAAMMLNLPAPEAVTVAIECCYQNVGIATSVALAMFQGDDLNEAMGVPFFYGAVEVVSVGLFCLLAWKAGWTKAPSDAPLWQILITSYEVLEYERRDVEGVEISISESSEPEPESLNAEGNILTTYFNMAWLVGPPAPNTNTEKTVDTVA